MTLTQFMTLTLNMLDQVKTDVEVAKLAFPVCDLDPDWMNLILKLDLHW